MNARLSKFLNNIIEREPGHYSPVSILARLIRDLFKYDTKILKRYLIYTREYILWFFISKKKLSLKRKNELRTVGMILGPYRNLTTLLSSTLFLHPNCQVLNHAERRVLSDKKMNFFRDYSQDKFDRFCHFVFFASMRGVGSDYGGSILLDHAFNSEVMRNKYRNRYSNTVLKDRVNNILWKSDLLATNCILENKIELSSLCEQNELLRFIMPVRNPIDCAMSNRGRHAKRFLKTKDFGFKKTLENILLLFSWFLDQKKHCPERCFYFFEHEIDRDLLIKLADFLKLDPDQKWINDSLSVLDIRKKPRPPVEFVEIYKKMIDTHFKDHPVFIDGLKKFIT